VARDNSGNVLANTNVSFRISILKNNVNGTVVYSELQFVSTDQYGMVSLAIGTGIVTSGVFANIDWAGDTYYFKTEFDQNGGGSFQVMGTSQLLSVPYALHAKTVSEHFDPQYPDGYNGMSIFINNATYTVPVGKTLVLNKTANYNSVWKVLLGNDTLLGNWHFIPESTTIRTINWPNEGAMGLLFDKKSEIIILSTQTNYLVPAGKTLYLFLPTLPNGVPNGDIGYFRINGNNNINSYDNEIKPPQLLILPSGYTIEYVDGTNPFADLYPRVFTGYLK
jgi:hypothetical protein